MKIRKVPMRSCVVTREKCEKKDLIRIVRTPENEVIVDLTGKANGRGAYLKKDMNVFLKAEKDKTLDKVLGVPVEKEIFEKLRSIIE